MDSFFARNRLSAYLDGALSDAEAAEVSEAIEHDPELRAEFEALQHALDLLRREGPAEAPAGFHARVMEQVRDEPMPGGVVVQLRRVFTRVPVEALALVAAAAVVMVVIGGKPDPTDEALQPAADLQLPMAKSGAPADDARGGTRQAAAPAAPPPPQTAAPYGGAYDEPVADAAASSRPAGQKKLVAAPPTEPMQAEWETQPQAGNLAEEGPRRKADMAVPFGYRMSVSDANTLYAMGKLAERYQGSIKDSAGRSLKARALSPDDDFAQLMVVVPKASEGAMHGDLAAMGGQPTVPPPDSPMFSAEYAVFFVEVRYAP